jgi:hypothetical protein
MKLACGVLAGPAFVGSFSALGATRRDYNWRRHAVSSLADGREGWRQCANFLITGALYCIAASGLTQSPRSATGPQTVPTLIRGAGVGLVGSGLFVTDPVAGFPDPPPHARSLGGGLHNVCAIPIFCGIPAAALLSSGSAARRGDARWAAYSATSAVTMFGGALLFGAAFGGAPRLAPWGGLIQRLSIASGFGWVSALSLRSRRSLALGSTMC